MTFSISDSCTLNRLQYTENKITLLKLETFQTHSRKSLVRFLRTNRKNLRSLIFHRMSKVFFTLVPFNLAQRFSFFHSVLSFFQWFLLQVQIKVHYNFLILPCSFIINIIFRYFSTFICSIIKYIIFQCFHILFNKYNFPILLYISLYDKYF